MNESHYKFHCHCKKEYALLVKPGLIRVFFKKLERIRQNELQQLL